MNKKLIYQSAILLLAMLLTVGKFSLADQFVVDASDPDCCATGPVYCEIQQAVSAAANGDKIRVHSGTYKPFVIEIGKDNLTIRPARPHSRVVVDGNLNPGAENGVEVDANGVTIVGLTVQNASATGSSSGDGNGFLVTGDNNTLIGNAVIDSYRGFQVATNGGNTLIGNVAVGNNQQAFLIDNSDCNRLYGNLAFDNGFGFAVSFGHDNIFVGNLASDNHLFGYYSFASYRNAFKHNLGCGNTSDGFFLEFSDDNSLTGNRASGNGIGFRLEFSDDNALNGNTASDNFYGFFIFSSDGNTFKNNKAIYNEQWGFFIDDLLANIFKNNQCRGNGLGGSNQPGVCSRDKKPKNR